MALFLASRSKRVRSTRASSPSFRAPEQPGDLGENFQVGARLTLRPDYPKEDIYRVIINRRKRRTLGTEHERRPLGRYVFYGGMRNRDAIPNACTLKLLTLSQLAVYQLLLLRFARKETRKLRQNLRSVRRLL